MKGKGNDGTGDNESRDNWRTNQDLWNILNKQYCFGFDCCANEEDTKCIKFSNDFLNIVNLEEDICWMNPPFSKAKEMFEHFFKVVKKGVAIFRCDNMETKIWQEIILKNADWVFIPKGRYSYIPFDTIIRTNGKLGCRFPSALIGIGVPSIRDMEGITLEEKKE